jgi:hypothetical protein
MRWKSVLLVFPKEHGAWAVLFVPMIVGAVIADRFSANLILLFISALGFFLAYQPVQILLRNVQKQKLPDEKLHAAKSWGPAFLAWGAIPSVFLFLQGLWLLVPIGVFALSAFFLNLALTHNRPKSIASDFAAVVGLTTTGPAASYVITGSLEPEGLIVWLLNVLFFGSSVFYVHMKISASSLKKEVMTGRDKLRVGQHNILYHIALLAAVTTLTSTFETPAVVVAAFVPVSLHALIGTVRLSSRVRFKVLGFLLLGQSLFFAIFLSMTFVST